VAQEESQRSIRHNHLVAQITKDVRRKKCKEIQEMRIGNVKRLHIFGQHVEEDEMEHSSSKVSNEYEKAQLVSQENAMDVQTADEARSMIDVQLHFCLFNVVGILSPYVMFSTRE
jgi:hypothetical protein